MQPGQRQRRATAITGRLDDGTDCMLFRRDFLESTLDSYDEDNLLAVVQTGLSASQVKAVGIVAYRRTFTTDPASKAGSGYPLDRALALAAVEALEGARRRPERRS